MYDENDRSVVVDGKTYKLPEHWSLYNELRKNQSKAVKQAIADLDSALVTAYEQVRSGMSVEDAIIGMFPAMTKHQKLGAFDTEPRETAYVMLKEFKEPGWLAVQMARWEKDEH